MSHTLALVIGAVLCYGKAETPKEVLAAVRESADGIDSYHVYLECMSVDRAENKAEAIPVRPASLPSLGQAGRREYFEDRFDRTFGRSLVSLESLADDALPSAALTRKFSATGKLKDAAVSRPGRDLLFAIRPKYATFDLIDLLDQHPDTRLRTFGALDVVEVPIESLAEYSELGVRILTDPKRGQSIVGVDLYVAAGGAELLFGRVDIDLAHVNGKHWLPGRVQYWQGLMPSESRASWGFDATDAVFHWNRSEIGQSLTEEEVGLAELRVRETERTPVKSDWEFVQYQMPPKLARPMAHPERAGTRLWLFAANGVVLLAIASWLAMRYLKRARS